MSKMKMNRDEARLLAIKAGIDFKKDYHQLKNSEVDILLALAKSVGYRKPQSASGSKGRYFFYYLQRG